MPWAELNDTVTRYEDTGGDGQPLVLVHEMGGTRGVMAALESYTSLQMAHQSEGDMADWWLIGPGMVPLSMKGELVSISRLVELQVAVYEEARARHGLSKREAEVAGTAGVHGVDGESARFGSGSGEGFVVDITHGLSRFFRVA